MARSEEADLLQEIQKVQHGVFAPHTYHTQSNVRNSTSRSLAVHLISVCKGVLEKRSDGID